VIHPRRFDLTLLRNTNIPAASWRRLSSHFKASSIRFSARSRRRYTCSNATSIRRGTAKQSFLKSLIGTPNSLSLHR
jgi:hypothetical protein